MPSYFRHDLFRLVGEHRRPPYRWFLLGPKRSGTGVHVDPLGTSAWNTLLVGRKRWLLFEPHHTRTLVKGKRLVRKGEDDEPINYYADIVPRLIEEQGETFKVWDFIQEPMETIFLPGGWWHAVLNLEDSVAITQNFASPANFDRVWPQVSKKRVKMAKKLVKMLEREYPELGRRARQLDEKPPYVQSSSSSSSSSTCTDPDTLSAVDLSKLTRQTEKVAAPSP